MALRLKTAQFAFPVLASVTNNTLTNFTQITVYLPESTKTIKKAWVEISADDIITATGGTVTTKTVDLRLAAVAYTSTTNANALTHSGENMSIFLERNFTTHFTTNWTGTSMTCDVRVQFNQSTGTTTGFVNVCCILNITYEYDDTATTQLKTVWIPLNGPTGALPTTKTSHDTIPALDTYLPEASKTYRNIFVVSQANTGVGTVTDHTVTYELSSLGTHTTGNYESALQTDRWTRYVWNITSYITTNTTHTFNVWSSLTGRHTCLQAWLVVTYEFNATTTTSVLNSLMIPSSLNQLFGGPQVFDFRRSEVEISVQESSPLLTGLAFYCFWQNIGNEQGLAARIGSGSFISYTSTGAGVIAGNKGLMIRNDNPSGINFGRGNNRIFSDFYNTFLTSKAGNVAGFWILDYVSDKHISGVGAHNHTVLWPLHIVTGTFQGQEYSLSGYVPIPEPDYAVSALGLRLEEMMMNTTATQGYSVEAQVLPSEGSENFKTIMSTVGGNDAEAGLNSCYEDISNFFTRWNNDADTDRLALLSSRKYSMYAGGGIGQFHNSLLFYVNYHTIKYNISGNISNSNGGNVNINLHDYNTDKKLMSTTRSGNGPYSFTFFDNTAPVYASAYENSSYKGRSGTGIAT